MRHHLILAALLASIGTANAATPSMCIARSGKIYFVNLGECRPGDEAIECLLSYGTGHIVATRGRSACIRRGGRPMRNERGN